MSAPCINYQDSVQIIKPIIDEYGTEQIGQVETIPALFIQNTGWSRGGANEMNVTSDAEIYIDPTHWFILQNADRLEGMMVIANPFGASSSDSWYRIINAQVGQDKLLTNEIDNVLLRLKKSVEIPYVS